MIQDTCETKIYLGLIPEGWGCHGEETWQQGEGIESGTWSWELTFFKCNHEAETVKRKGQGGFLSLSPVAYFYWQNYISPKPHQIVPWSGDKVYRCPRLYSFKLQIWTKVVHFKFHFKYTKNRDKCLLLHFYNVLSSTFIQVICC